MENQNLEDKAIGKVGKFMNVNGEQFDNQLFSVREDVQVQCSLFIQKQKLSSPNSDPKSNALDFGSLS